MRGEQKAGSGTNGFRLPILTSASASKVVKTLYFRTRYDKRNLCSIFTAQYVDSVISDSLNIAKMIEFSDCGRPALGAITSALPANLPNRFRRLAGYLVRRVMKAHGYELVRKNVAMREGSMFKRAACYRALR